MSQQLQRVDGASPDQAKSALALFGPDHGQEHAIIRGAKLTRQGPERGIQGREKFGSINHAMLGRGSTENPVLRKSAESPSRILPLASALGTSA